MEWFFAEERRGNVLVEEKWKRILKYLVECLSSSNNKERETTRIAAVKALIWHTDNCEKFFYASRFMAMLAQRILTQHESSLKEALRSIVTT